MMFTMKSVAIASMMTMAGLMACNNSETSPGANSPGVVPSTTTNSSTSSTDAVNAPPTRGPGGPNSSPTMGNGTPTMSGNSSTTTTGSAPMGTGTDNMGGAGSSTMGGSGNNGMNNTGGGAGRGVPTTGNQMKDAGTPNK